MTAEPATARIRRLGGTPVLKQAGSHAMMMATTADSLLSEWGT